MDHDDKKTYRFRDERDTAATKASEWTMIGAAAAMVVGATGTALIVLAAAVRAIRGETK